MTTICGTTLNETGERVLKITLTSIASVTFLTGFIMALVTMHNQDQSVFTIGIMIAILGIILGSLFLALTKCCGYKRNEYEPINDRLPILV